MVKNILLWLGKALVAGLLALVLACVVSFFYYNPGIHHTSTTGATDYVWEANTLICRMTEGFYIKFTDENGFQGNGNAQDEEIDVLLMGSSQAEGQGVGTTQTFAWLMNEGLELNIYNIGTSGHTLLRCVKNLATALDTYTPSGYLMIETSTVSFTEAEITAALDGTMSSLKSYDSGPLAALQKLPYFKLAYYQLQTWQSGSEEESSEAGDLSPTAYAALAAYIAGVCADYDIQPILMYHPRLSLNEDGSVSLNTDETALALLQEVCDAWDILLVDMTEDFLALYASDFILPNGFYNTSVGGGHLNCYGHAAIANRLIQVLTDLEEGKEVPAP